MYCVLNTLPVWDTGEQIFDLLYTHLCFGDVLRVFIALIFKNPGELLDFEENPSFEIHQRVFMFFSWWHGGDTLDSVGNLLEGFCKFFVEQVNVAL